MGAMVAFVVGWLLQDLFVCLSIFGLSFATAAILCIPPWPMYNRYRTEWLPNRPKDGQEKSE
ncbi:hypothetical protein IE53DRAFT_386130 [Violaceomyces palustris]|uniref:Uncharacterized protein n=1 Tax=Violaceomyces palustris TaxID=1673888 RepID=A0ACD0P0I2_9BASI|nr:hypothetical protein IE53DRAFT_386130 [Violaceomyces palustris]